MKELSLRSYFIPFVLAFFVFSGFSVMDATSAVAAKPVKYKIDKGTLLRLDVYHPAKHVIAKSKQVKGFATALVNGGAIKLGGALSVRIMSLRSGNRRRDRVMWSSLGKSRQPYIYFYPTSLTLKGAAGTLQGTFQIRKKKQKVTLQVTGFQGKLDGTTPVSLTVKGKLKCSDFSVKRPSLLFVKIKDKVDLTISLKMVPAKS